MKKMNADHVTCIGSNHIKAQKVCEDASGSFQDEMMCICAAADGHGSDNYPRTEQGSSYAIQASLDAVIEFVRTADPDEVVGNDGELLMVQLEKNILKKWHQLVEEDYAAHPFGESELDRVSKRYQEKYRNESSGSFAKAYGTTLILFAVTEQYSFGIQIGDGKCVVIDPDGTCKEPIPWDDECQMNVTTSICDENAIEEFRHIICREAPAAVFCGTDGIDDSYASSNDLHAFYRSVLSIFYNYSAETAHKELEEYLPYLTKKGSGDDVSVAYIVDLGQGTPLERMS